MEVVWASAIRLIEKARDAHPQVDSLQRLRVVLARTMARTHSDAIFAAWLKKMVDSFLTIFSVITGMVDDLTARLQAMCVTHTQQVFLPRLLPRSPLPWLVSLETICSALVTLQLSKALPAAPADVYMEVAIIVQRLAHHDELDLFISLLDQCVFQGTPGVNNAYTAASLRRRDILDNFAKKHANLAGTIAPCGASN